MSTRGHVIPCSVFGGRSPKTRKPVGTRHRWSGEKWGEGTCIYCNRTLEQVCEEKSNQDGGDRKMAGIGIAFDGIVTTSEEYSDALMAAVQARIKRYDSQSAAAREWGVAQSTVNEIANGSDRYSSRYLAELLLRDGATIWLKVVD